MALLLPVLLAFLALASDAGLVLHAAQQMQTAADAAALAGAALVRVDIAQARTAAVQFAAANAVLKQSVVIDRNDANAEGGDVVIGHYNRRTAVFTATLDEPNAVRVVGHRDDVPLVFTGPLGRSLATVNREAIAMLGGGTGAGLITLDPNADCSLDVRGHVILTVNDITGPTPTDGAIQVNSSHECAACASGGPTIDAGELNVHGDACLGNANYAGETNPGSPVIPDPLASIPDYTSRIPVRTSPGKSETAVLEPGYYPNGITRTGGSLTMSPGIYVLDGAGFNISGGSSVTANGVMLYTTGSGVLDMTGNGPVTITPPTSGTYEGISIFQARDNLNEARIIGTTAMNLQGTFYFPSNPLELGGNGISVGNQLIVNTLYVHGDGVFTINYDGRNPAPGGKVFLVH